MKVCKHLISIVLYLSFRVFFSSSRFDLFCTLFSFICCYCCYIKWTVHKRNQKLTSNSLLYANSCYCFFFFARLFDILLLNVRNFKCKFCVLCTNSNERLLAAKWFLALIFHYIRVLCMLCLYVMCVVACVWISYTYIWYAVCMYGVHLRAVVVVAAIAVVIIMKI